MDILNYTLQIVSVLATIVGLYFVAKKNRFGFILYIVSLGCQATIFFIGEIWILFAQMMILLICNIYPYLKWKKDEEETNEITT